MSDQICLTISKTLGHFVLASEKVIASTVDVILVILVYTDFFCIEESVYVWPKMVLSNQRTGICQSGQLLSIRKDGMEAAFRQCLPPSDKRT